MADKRRPSRYPLGLIALKRPKYSRRPRCLCPIIDGCLTDKSRRPTAARGIAEQKAKLPSMVAWASIERQKPSRRSGLVRHRDKSVNVDCHI